jgi:glycosyltransferase involved in cell wall biosynthesis
MNIGGPAFQISELLGGLDSAEFEHKLIIGSCKLPEIEIDAVLLHKEKIFKSRNLGKGVNLFRDLLAFIEIRELIRSWKPDIVHTHTAKAGVLGRLAAISFTSRPKVVHTFHGHLLFGYFPKVITKTIILIERFLARHTNQIVSVGHQVMKDLLDADIGKKDQYCIIPPGIEIKKYGTEKKVREDFKIANDDYCIVWIGRLVAIKNPMQVLDLAKLISNEFPRIKFLMVGDGELRELIHRRILDEDIPAVLLGWRTDIFDVLSLAKLVIQTSLNEGTPLAIIQAQMEGIPVISTAVGSVSEIIENGITGNLVQNNIQEFRYAISKYLLNESLRIEVGKRARVRAVETYSARNLISKHQDVYRKLAI